MPETKTPVLISGAPRSGLTLLRLILDAHSQIAAPPETGLIAEICQSHSAIMNELGTGFSQNYAVEPEQIKSQFQNLFASIFTNSLDQIYVDKSSANLLLWRPIHRLFPKVKMILMVRDGRDVVSSLQACDWRSANGKLFPYCVNEMAAARFWLQFMAAAKELGDDPQILRVRYEDLILRPAQTLDRICQFLGVAYQSGLLAFWEQENLLTPLEQQSSFYLRQPIHADHIRHQSGQSKLPIKVQAVLQPVLRELGYF
jgi:hypothetical protein